ncbi:MAG: hypothetical protein H7319_20420 [Spirosoma sp.]|nr:hypothetical protein [Spirosoma sp.]
MTHGRGIDGQGKDGRGLQNVAARLKVLDGQWSVESNADTGVKHSISIPVNATNRLG